MFHFYVALTFWLLVCLLEAYGIFKLWEGLPVRPRWINLVLLPGTLVAETAHFLAALLTGAPVREAKLVSDEPVGQAGDGGDSDKGIPVLGPLLTALLPIVAGVAIIYALYSQLESGVVRGFASGGAGGVAAPLDKLLTQRLGWRLDDWFAVAVSLLTLGKRLIDTLPLGSLEQAWRSWLFIYLTGCLAIRMVPLRGNLRSGMAAMVLIGLLAGGLGWLLPSVHSGLGRAWSLVAYVVALLTLLLLVSLLVRGIVALGFVLADKPLPKRS